MGGTNTDAMLGLCEQLWRSDMNEDELFEVVSQCILSSVEVDAYAG